MTASRIVAWASAIVAVAAGIALICCGFVGVASSVGLVAADPASLDRGKLPWKKHRIALELVNRSESPIEILDVQTSCDCLRTSFSGTDRLAVDQPHSIMLDWDTRGRDGPIMTDVTVAYRALAGAGGPLVRRQFRLLAESIPTISLNPKTLMLNAESSVVRPVALSVQDNSSVRILSATTSSESLWVIIGDDGRSMHVGFDPKKWLPNASPESVRIVTSHEDATALRLPVRIVAEKVPP